MFDHPNSSQMIDDLQQEIKETYSIELTDVSGMDVMESISDHLASFNPVLHFNRFFILTIFIPVFTIIILLDQKCILAYLPKNVTHDR